MQHNIFLSDCLTGMASYPDKYFDLAVVDPPYGIGVSKMGLGKGGGIAKNGNYDKKEWDSVSPNTEYFYQLQRVSKNQIIWGANHFLGWPSSCWLVWDKLNGETDFADCELAYTSFNSPVRKFTFKWAGMLQGNMKNKEQRIHPTQKPVALYDWIYKNYLPNGGKVLDTHGGSMSNLISAIKAGNIEMDIYELDSDYYNDSRQRVTDFCKQLNMFQPQPKLNWIC